MTVAKSSIVGFSVSVLILIFHSLAVRSDWGRIDLCGIRNKGSRPAQVEKPYPLPAAASIFFLKLSGLMSVHTSLMYARHSALLPLLPASVQPSAFSLWAGHIEINENVGGG
jgi:hypothetical protein